jgi:hypothetical protein
LSGKCKVQAQHEAQLFRVTIETHLKRVGKQQKVALGSKYCLVVAEIDGWCRCLLQGHIAHVPHPGQEGGPVHDVTLICECASLALLCQLGTRPGTTRCHKTKLTHSKNKVSAHATAGAAAPCVPSQSSPRSALGRR